MHSIKLVSEELTPSKVVCVGRNYTAHIAELNNETPDQMVLFNKPNSAITNTLFAAHNGDTLHYETELCFVVKDKKFVGVGLGLDLTKRTAQSKLKNKGLPWERAKAFDGSVILTDFVALTDAMKHFTFELKINNEVIHGDVIMTGTPSGVGEVTAKSIFAVALYANDQCLLEHQWQVSKN